ncbi:MAG TPA: aspartate 1-decarboxylase [Thermoanaerobaculia bacterium]|nr:aspartate 1-decarboxylase [Thermoanaerobaculia bacterium]
MKRTLLKSKIHRATVTDANLHYQGSITIDPVLMAAADLVPHEKLEIYNCTNGERLATYVISGTPDQGEIVINGAAAHKVRPGDIVILASYADYEDADSRSHKPSLVYVDARNRILFQGHERIEMPLAVEAEG